MAAFLGLGAVFVLQGKKEGGIFLGKPKYFNTPSHFSNFLEVALI